MGSMRRRTKGMGCPAGALQAAKAKPPAGEQASPRPFSSPCVFDCQVGLVGGIGQEEIPMIDPCRVRIPLITTLAGPLTSILFAPIKPFPHSWSICVDSIHIGGVNHHKMCTSWSNYIPKLQPVPSQRSTKTQFLPPQVSPRPSHRRIHQGRSLCNRH